MLKKKKNNETRKAFFRLPSVMRREGASTLRLLDLAMGAMDDDAAQTTGDNGVACRRRGGSVYDDAVEGRGGDGW